MVMNPVTRTMLSRSKFAIIAFSLLFASCKPTSESRSAKAAVPLRLGVVVAATGPIAAYGEADRRGAELAAAEHHVTLLIEDDQGRPEQSANAVERLITGEKVVAVMCCDTSGGTLAASPIAEREHTPIMTPTASAPQVTVGKHFTFRVCATDDGEARAAARLARERLGAKRVVILRDTKNDYSVGMAATFAAAFQSAGGSIAGTFDYSEGDSDFRGQLTAAAAEHPDALFLPGYYGDVSQIVLQARDLGISVPMLGGSGWDSPKLIEIAGKALEGCHFVSGVRSASPQFVAAFRKRYGVEPDAANAQAYDVISLLVDAVRRGGRNPQQVRDAISATRNFQGASGAISIDKDGNARKPLAAFRIVGSKYVEEGRIEN
ncbi:MAG: ABC transporter substrate-binding protein [Acidobacteriota bacterium]